MAKSCNELEDIRKSGIIGKCPTKKTLSGKAWKTWCNKAYKRLGKNYKKLTKDKTLTNVYKKSYKAWFLKGGIKKGLIKDAAYSCPASSSDLGSAMSSSIASCSYLAGLKLKSLTDLTEDMFNTMNAALDYLLYFHFNLTDKGYGTNLTMYSFYSAVISVEESLFTAIGLA